MDREANKHIFQGKWEEVKGKIKHAWGRLTDDDLKQIEGDQQILYGKLQEKYGYTRKKIDELIKEMQNNW